ncbi:MAG TPA: response regulator transcription factor [Verrucomicrobiae bacterium]|nr:response regulator transcription factor [Verrucomicrobiae bacterium]
MNSNAKKIRVMMVDDHFLVRMGLIASINLEPDMVVECEASTGEQAITLYRRHKTDIVMMDLKLPGISGVDATKTICKEFPSAAIIMLSTYDGEEDIYRSLQAGACTYLLKSASRNELIETIRAVHAGERRISPTVASRLADRTRHSDLTVREMDVLALMAKGRSNKEIAAELAIARVTAKLHVGNILAKLGVHDRTQAVTTALQRGIVHLD